jgi:uncharacterized membrane protein YkgB
MSYYLLNRKMLLQNFDKIDRTITHWMANYGLLILRIGLGVVFFWFGALKLVPGLSPAEELVVNLCASPCCCSFCKCLGPPCPY